MNLRFGVCDLLCVCKESCVYVREVVCMSGKLCVCQGSCVYVSEVGCMSGKLCVCEGS